MTGQSYDYGIPVTVNIFRPFVTHARRTADLLLEKMKNKIKQRTWENINNTSFIQLIEYFDGVRDNFTLLFPYRNKQK